MVMIDTHAHLNFNAYRNDLEEVIKRSLAENIWVINVGSNYKTSKKAVEIAGNYREGVYAAIGLHPIHLATDLVKVKTDPEEGAFEAKGEDFDKEKYRKLALSGAEGSCPELAEGSCPELAEGSCPELAEGSCPELAEGSCPELAEGSKKVIAIGEIGLDYYYRPKTKRKLELFKEKQKEVFLKELDLAKELNLPVIFHCRKAHQDLLEVLKLKIKNQNSKIEGVVHCFTGDWEQAKEYLDMGFYLGFNGIIYKLDLREVIEKTPLEKILIETDCPYLTPPQAGADRNEPIFVKYIAQEIAKIKNLDYQRVAEITTQNARKLFNI